MRRFLAPSSGLDKFFAAQFSAGYITSMSGFDLRQAQDLNQGFEKFAQHLKQNGLSWPRLLASAFNAGKTRVMMTCDSESLDTLLRTLERSKDLRKERETLSSVTR